MKRFFLFTVALLGAITMKAQETDAMSATLQSGETTTVYSGADAFKNALAAAEDGSVITLSSGTFNDPGAFAKSVKVYGAGFQNDEETGVKCTRVLSGVSIKKDDEGKFHDNLRLEGIWFTGGVSIENVEGEILTGLQNVIREVLIFMETPIQPCCFSPILKAPSMAEIRPHRIYWFRIVMWRNTSIVSGVQVMF